MSIEENDWVYLKILFSEQMQIDHRGFIHPDDKHLIQNDLHLGLLKCTSLKDGYYTFRDRNKGFIRVLKGAIKKKMPTPKFDFEEEVLDLTKTEPTIGYIYKIDWHSNKGEYMYFIRVNDKNKSRRYFENELIKSALRDVPKDNVEV